ncbi:class I SAM-dependent methyltransferase [Halovivax cerinus]|uniref:Class I SAM-dependent methyltransferase n=1 Tax=Halovivax cerinus TaxID=1487865 RepID=A0ABD5NJW8_9EURY|nr:class I SAM-dependent methyltransferase [Halovivax cerinus]
MPHRRDVRDTYERIGSHFATTREYAWPEVDDFVADVTRERTFDRGLDLGCGNCRHAEVLAGHVDRVVGVDASRALLDAGRERARTNDFLDTLSPVQGDAASLALRTDAVDLAVYVATLHHLPTRTLRRRSLDELARVLTSDGRALVSAWSTAHDRFEDASASDESGFDTSIEWTLPGGETVDRFYHVYAPAAFESDLAESDLQLREWEVSSGNCYARVAGAP